MPSSELDGISLGIIHSRLTSVADEAAAMLVRTVFSHIIRDAKDFAIGLLDADCRTICQSTQSIPVFLGTMSRTARRLVSDCSPFSEGDIALTNDPWIGSGHLPDINMLMPVFVEDSVAGYVVVIAHVADIGGRILGVDSNDNFEEGLHIPPMKLRTGDIFDATLLQLLKANVRLPEQVTGDVMAMVNAGETASQRLKEVLRDSDLADLRVVSSALESRGEEAMRSAISRLSVGSYRSRQLVERESDDIVLEARIDVDPVSKTIVVDYEGTSAQVATGHNATATYTRAYTVYALKCLFAPELPFTEGIFRPVDVRIPERTVLNSEPPVAVGGRHLVGQLAATLVVEAMAESTPELSIAECGSPRPFVTIAGRRESGAPFSMPLLVMGGFGGRVSSDGPSALPFPTNTEAVPVEMLESTAPLFVESKELAIDSGGPGRFRGGLGQRMDVISLIDNLRVSVMAIRSRHPAQGLFGGGSGARTRIVSERQGEDAKEIAGTVRIMKGERLSIQSPGGGGYGRPIDRERSRIESDVENGYVSRTEADAGYGLA
jgi:N-methylhydantoinase B